MSKFVLFAALLLFLKPALSAEIIGPESVPAGELAVFESGEPGAWAIWPECRIEADSAGDKVFFASNIETEFTLIFCHIVDGAPVIETKNFVNGVLPEPGPGPEPKPEPEPEKKLSAEEKETARWAFESVISHIDGGRLRTQQGVRSTFKNAVMSRLETVSDAFSAQLDKWTEETDFTSMDSIRASFSRFLAELED